MKGELIEWVDDGATPGVDWSVRGWHGAKVGVTQSAEDTYTAHMGTLAYGVWVGNCLRGFKCSGTAKAEVEKWIQRQPADHPWRTRPPYQRLVVGEAAQDIPAGSVGAVVANAAATPEPPPTGDGTDVTLALIEDLAELGSYGPLVADLVERRAFGKEKYGTVLRTHNGRNHLIDAYQEALDLVVYLKAGCLEDDEEAWGLIDEAISLARALSRVVPR